MFLKKISLTLLMMAGVPLFSCAAQTVKSTPENISAKMSKAQLSVSHAAFGVMPSGVAATLYTLTNANGLIVKVTNYGGIITEIHTPDKNGKLGDITLGYDNVNDYVKSSPYFGALIGRYGNRIAKGKFSLDGHNYQLDVNNGVNHLHGGAKGFDKVVWDVKPFETKHSVGLTLTYLSVDGEQGYPGNLKTTAVYELNNANELITQFTAVTDKATPVNLTQHTYFNLAGKGDILGHELMIPADRYTPVDAGLIPTGEWAKVEGTPFDFRTPHLIGERIAKDDQQLKYGLGYDHNFVLNKSKGTHLAARVQDPESGRVLEVWSQEPGVQFYSGNFLDGTLTGKGRTYAYRSGFCLEPQHFPDSPNQPTFPSTILKPGEQYSTQMRFKFSVKK